MNILDKIIGWVSPAWGYQRAENRRRLEIVARGYEAAAHGRRTANWRAPSTSATAENGAALALLRNRSRELVRNNAYARRAVKVIADNVVASGILPTISIDRKNSAALEAKIKSAWKAWAGKSACDFGGRLSFIGLQRLIMLAVAESGECVIVKRVNPAKAMPLELQVLEGDYIDHIRHTYPMPNADGSFDFYGVRFDANGRRVGLWLYDKHPTDVGATLESRLVPDSDVIHVFEMLRPEQARGVPAGVAAFLRMRDFDQYEDTQLLRQKIAACFSVFVRTPDTGALNAGDTNEYDRVEPGIIQTLAPGEDVSFAAPPTVEGYEAYSRQQLRAISAAFGISYEALTNDLSNVNFSSGRMGWIEMHKTITALQRDVLIPALDRVWEWFTQFLTILGTKNVPVTVEWTYPRREMIDPVKESTATIQQVRAGLISQQEALREQGYNPEDTVAEIQQWYKMIDEAGLLLATDLRVEAKAQNVAGDGVTNQNSA